MVEFDIIVIGGGINGLTAAAYLAKAGMSVVVFERRDELGTHCSTEEVTIPGFRHNLHANQIFVGAGPCIEDLDLERFGLELCGNDTPMFIPFKDRKALTINTWDVRVNYKTFSNFSHKDGETFRKICNQFGPSVGDFLATTAYTPSIYLTPEVMNKLMNMILKCEVIPPDFVEMNSFEFIDLLFEDEHIKSYYVAASEPNGVRIHDRMVGAINALVGIISFGCGMQICTTKGGSHRLPHALSKCVTYHGGKMFQSCGVEKIIVEDGEAKGVILAKDSAYPGKKILARKAVISNLTVAPTFLQLVGEEYLEPSFVAKVKNYDYTPSLFGAHYALNELPKWECASFDPKVGKAWNFFYGAETVRDHLLYTGQILRGEIPDPIVSNGGSGIPTLIDQTQAPPGKHVLWTWVVVPPDIRKYGGFEKWDEVKYELLDKITERINEYAPNFKKSILAAYAHSPLDVYRRNPSAVKGSWCGGVFAVGQFLERPFAGCGAPRTPIKKLYLSNSILPLCNTQLGAGYNAAVIVAEDLGIRKQTWWVHKPLTWQRKWIERMGGQWRVTVD